MKFFKIPNIPQFFEPQFQFNQMSLAQWSRGMIRASGARGPGFKSRLSPPKIFSFNEFFFSSLFQVMMEITIVTIVYHRTEYIKNYCLLSHHRGKLIHLKVCFEYNIYSHRVSRTFSNSPLGGART